MLSLVSRKVFANLTFHDALIEATIIDYAQKASTPTFAWTLAYDSVVSSNSTRMFSRTGQGNKFVSSYEFDNTEFNVCGMSAQKEPVDHYRAEIVGNIFTLAFLERNK